MQRIRREQRKQMAKGGKGHCKMIIIMVMIIIITIITITIIIIIKIIIIIIIIIKHSNKCPGNNFSIYK